MGYSLVLRKPASFLNINNKIPLQPLQTTFVIVASGCASTGNVAMKVKNSMHKGAHWVSPETPVTTLAQMMREQDIGAIRVGENDRLIGMVTDRDIALRAVADGKASRASLQETS